MELVAKTGLSLGATWDALPGKILMGHRRIPCAWDKKGLVMRLAQEEGHRNKNKTELIDGVKIYLEDGWVLILPDANEAYCHVWAEAETQKKADHYLNEYAEKIKKWQEKAEGASASLSKT